MILEQINSQCKHKIIFTRQKYRCMFLHVSHRWLRRGNLKAHFQRPKWLLSLLMICLSINYLRTIMMKSPIIIHNTSPVFSTPSDLHFFIKQSKNHQLVGLGSPGNCSLTKNTLKKSTRPENAWHAYSQIRKGLDWYKRNWSKHILALKKRIPLLSKQPMMDLSKGLCAYILVMRCYAPQLMWRRHRVW